MACNALGGFKDGVANLLGIDKSKTRKPAALRLFCSRGVAFLFLFLATPPLATVELPGAEFPRQVTIEVQIAEVKGKDPVAWCIGPGQSQGILFDGGIKLIDHGDRMVLTRPGPLGATKITYDRQKGIQTIEEPGKEVVTRPWKESARPISPPATVERPSPPGTARLVPVGPAPKDVTVQVEPGPATTPEEFIPKADVAPWGKSDTQGPSHTEIPGSQRVPITQIAEGAVKNRGLNPAQVERMLLMSADDVDSPGWDQLTGYGRLNARKALEADKDYYLYVELYRVAAAREGGKTVLQVFGTAKGSHWGSYHLEVGQGENPTSWKKAGQLTGGQVDDSVLGTLTRGDFGAAGKWAIRLVAEDRRGIVRESRTVFTLQ
jgi:hypothetical protein